MTSGVPSSAIALATRPLVAPHIQAQKPEPAAVVGNPMKLVKEGARATRAMRRSGTWQIEQ